MMMSYETPPWTIKELWGTKVTKVTKGATGAEVLKRIPGQEASNYAPVVHRH